MACSIVVGILLKDKMRNDEIRKDAVQKAFREKETKLRWYRH